MYSVSSVVSDGFRLQTPLLNKCTRDLPGLKPTLRLLARAIRGHVIPRFSAAKKTTHPRFLFRVFRGERWFPVEDTVIEQVATQLARAKAQATVFGPGCHESARNPRSRHSAFFRGQKKDTHTLAKQPVLPPTVHNIPASGFSVP